MKRIFVYLLLICFLFLSSLQPYNPCYTPPPNLVAFYYKNGKLIKKENSNKLWGIYGTGIKNSPFEVNKGEFIHPDSIIIKIR